MRRALRRYTIEHVGQLVHTKSLQFLIFWPISNRDGGYVLDDLTLARIVNPFMHMGSDIHTTTKLCCCFV